MTGPNGDPTSVLTRTIRLFGDVEGLDEALRSPAAFVDDLPGFELVGRGSNEAPALRIDADGRRVSLLPDDGDVPAWHVVEADPGAPAARIEVHRTQRRDGCSLDVVARRVNARLDHPVAEIAVAAIYQLILNIEASGVDAGAASARPDVTAGRTASPGAVDQRDAARPADGVASWRRALTGVLAAGAAVLLIGWLTRRRTRSEGS